MRVNNPYAFFVNNGFLTTSLCHPCSLSVSSTLCKCSFCYQVHNSHNIYLTCFTVLASTTDAAQLFHCTYVLHVGAHLPWSCFCELLSCCMALKTNLCAALIYLVFSKCWSSSHTWSINRPNDPAHLAVCSYDAKVYKDANFLSYSTVVHDCPILQ